MSIFDPTSGKDPTDWLREKSLAALETAAKLVDLANEPDTTAWYAKNLKRIARELIARLLPMTALFHGVGDEGVAAQQWQDIVERGTFALTKWCRRWKVANPYHFAEAVTAQPREASETSAKRQTVSSDIVSDDEPHGTVLKLEIHRYMALQMVHDSLGDPAKSLLAWALFHLGLSQYADIVVLNKDFLPTDIGRTPEETGDGYRQLYQQGLIEKVDGLDIGERAIALRLVVDGLNGSKHAPAFQQEVFGKPGLRIQGKPTLGTFIELRLDAHCKYLQWLAGSSEKLRRLQDFLQQSMGNDQVYIEKVSPVAKSDGATVLEILCRYPLDSDDNALERRMKAAVETWIKDSKASAEAWDGFGPTAGGSQTAAKTEGSEPTE